LLLVITGYFNGARQDRPVLLGGFLIFLTMGPRQFAGCGPLGYSRIEVRLAWNPVVKISERQTL